MANVAGASNQVHQGCVCPQSVMTSLTDSFGQVLAFAMWASCGPTTHFWTPYNGAMLPK